MDLRKGVVVMRQRSYKCEWVMVMCKSYYARERSNMNEGGYYECEREG